jgi:hypothetical protein
MPKPLTEELHQLTIFEKSHDGKVSGFIYELECRTLGIFQRFESPRFAGDRVAYIDNLYKEIETRWVNSRRDVQAFNADLRAYGGQLFDELFPENLQRLLWENRDRIKSIMVISTEPFIPWEIIHLKPPNEGLPDEVAFLGQLGLVRWLHGSWPPDELRVAGGKARYIVPSYPSPKWALPQAQQEIQFLDAHFKATAVQPEKTQVLRLLQQEGAFDLLHFAGHGSAQQGNIANACVMLQGKMVDTRGEGRAEDLQYCPDLLDAIAVKNYARFGSKRPIVVLNACQVSRAGYQLTGIGGFAQAFLERRAGAFVGSLWSVGDYPARIFTEAWYTALLSGSSLAEATKLAREEARRLGGATWLAYAVYGHPHARLVQ